MATIQKINFENDPKYTKEVFKLPLDEDDFVDQGSKMQIIAGMLGGSPAFMVVFKNKIARDFFH